MRRVLALTLLLAGTAAGVAHAAPNPLTVKTDGEAVVVEVNDSQGAAFGVGVYKDGSAACYGQRYSKPTCVALLP